MILAWLLAYAAGASAVRAADEPKPTPSRYLAEQQALAEKGNDWAKYALYKAYRDGTHGADLDLRQADRWLRELVRGVHLVTFQPTNNFRPSTPSEFLKKFGETSSLRSTKDGIGGASFFRTRVHDGMLIGSFLTKTPDKLSADLARNPDLKLLWSVELTPGMFVIHEASKQESLPSGADGGLTETRQDAEAGSYWATYDLWAGYHKGEGGVPKASEKAEKLLTGLVKDAYLARFRPAQGFAPKTPHEFLAEFGKHSKLRSEPTGLGGASFFRTKVEGNVLIGSFLTAYPDRMRQAIKDNPSLELISIEKVTPEMFIRHDASPQESLK